MNNVLTIVDMQEEFVPSNWPQFYRNKRKLLVLVVSTLVEQYLDNGDDIVFIEFDWFWERIKELRKFWNIGPTIKKSNMFLYQALKMPENIEWIKLLNWAKEVECVWVNAQECVLNNAHTIQNHFNVNKHVWVNFSWIMDIDSINPSKRRLLQINVPKNILSEYSNSRVKLFWESLFEKEFSIG